MSGPCEHVLSGVTIIFMKSLWSVFRAGVEFDLTITWSLWSREINQQDATNPMFIIKLLSQHVSGIIMPIIRRTKPCITAYGVLHWLCWLWLCGAGS